MPLTSNTPNPKQLAVQRLVGVHKWEVAAAQDVVNGVKQIVDRAQAPAVPSPVKPPQLPPAPRTPTVHLLEAPPVSAPREPQRWDGAYAILRERGPAYQAVVDQNVEGWLGIAAPLAVAVPLLLRESLRPEVQNIIAFLAISHITSASPDQKTS